MICHKSDNSSIELCTKSILKNEILILPTDTVYGFSALVDSDGKNDLKIKKIKGRDENKPFIQLIANPEDIYKFSNIKIPEKIFDLWPGALTIIAPDIRIKNNKINTTAFRCPGDEWLRAVLKNCNGAIYSTSVNRSGFPVLDSEEEIIKEFSSEVDLIVLDGDKKNASPSTIIKIENDEIKILRQGSLIIHG